jgi:hypothetical protein
VKPGLKWGIAGGLAVVALPLMLVLYVVVSAGYAPPAGIDTTRIPALARDMLPGINQQLATECPELPAVWVVAQVMAESSWNPHAWTDDSNGGTAGLYQINQTEWRALGGQAWGVPAHTAPPGPADIYDAPTHLRLGIRLVCTHLRSMTGYLSQSGKPTPPLDAMLVCHIAGCGRVTGSRTGVPVVGEAGCGATCVDLITRYLNNVHRYVTEFTLQGSAGAVPPGIDIRAFGAPAAYTGPATGCTTPDPTTSGCLTAATAWDLNQIGTIFGGYRNGPVIKSTTCWDPHLQNPTSDHPKGKACDFFPGKGGVFATGDALVHGWQLAAWLRTYAGPLHVKYIIWQGRFWDPGTADTNGWGVPYDGGGIYDIHDPTGGHFDHIHLSVLE